jgi:hypothetical protein
VHVDQNERFYSRNYRFGEGRLGVAANAASARVYAFDDPELLGTTIIIIAADSDGKS